MAPREDDRRSKIPNTIHCTVLFQVYKMCVYVRGGRMLEGFITIKIDTDAGMGNLKSTVVSAWIMPFC